MKIGCQDAFESRIRQGKGIFHLFVIHLFCIWSLCIGLAFAADFAPREGDWGGFVIQGQITKGDYEKFLVELEPNDALRFRINWQPNFVRSEDADVCEIKFAHDVRDPISKRYFRLKSNTLKLDL